MKVWTNGGAREFELDTQQTNLLWLRDKLETNLLWLMLGLSSISVTNFTTFPQAVLWAAIDSRAEEEEEEEEEDQRIQ